ncbi:uncharacterized protein SPSK_10533 [Sporothrix schenckii 1099-18]|uniref:Uncharacterized protein n=1 Tax=Sporothrix schenckii 1099-18 TaxID=1397361 RepID=A0A0F2LZ51_SPOSC|nr:uncharacterized protein SPSK_10533 [Sporothrix schenckii 1099-18]KJR82738.1 hypothetical protein SPSK_10533 [Sporothrix schenckii 1099-18]
MGIRKTLKRRAQKERKEFDLSQLGNKTQGKPAVVDEQLKADSGDSISLNEPARYTHCRHIFCRLWDAVFALILDLNGHARTHRDATSKASHMPHGAYQGEQETCRSQELDPCSPVWDYRLLPWKLCHPHFKTPHKIPPEYSRGGSLARAERRSPSAVPLPLEVVSNKPPFDSADEYWRVRFTGTTPELHQMVCRQSPSAVMNMGRWPM